MLGAPPYRNLHYDSDVLSARHPDKQQGRVSDAVSHAYGNISIPRLVDFLMRAASEDSSDIDDDTRVSAADRRDALRILLSLICDLKAKSTAISEGAIAPVGFMMEADMDEGVRSYAAQVLASLLSVYQGRVAVETTGVVANLRKALTDPAGQVRLEACRAVLSLSDDIMGVRTVVENGLVVDLVKTLDDAAATVQEVAFHALSNVLREDDAAIEQALQNEMVATLVRILKQGEVADELVLFATLCLQHIANLHAGKAKELQDGAVPILTLLLDHYYEKVRAAAAGTLMVITINVTGKKVVREHAMERLGVLVLQDPDDTARHHATAALQHICEAPDGRKALIEMFGQGEGRSVVALVLGDPQYFK